MEEITLILLQLFSLLILFAIVIFILREYFKRDYLKGKRMSRKSIADPFRINKEVLDSPENTKAFQGKIFNHSLDIIIDKYNSELSKKNNQVGNIRQKIEKLEEERSKFISHLSTPRGNEGVLSNLTNADNDSRNIVRGINNEIESLKTQLKELNAKIINQDDPEDQNLYVIRQWKSLSLSFEKCFSKLPKVVPGLCLLAVDYIIAVSFFIDLAQDFRGNNWLVFTFGYVIPLSITVILLMFIHQILENQAKNKSVFYLSILPVILIFSILVIRLAGVLGSGNVNSISILEEIIIWLLFVGIVYSVGKLTVDKKDTISVWDLFIVPIKIFINIIIFVVLIPFWPIELFINSKKEKSKEKSAIRKIKKYIKLKEKERQKEENFIANKKRESELKEEKQWAEAEAEKKTKIQFIDNKIEKYKKEIGIIETNKHFWGKRLMNLRLGSDSGVIAGLRKHKSWLG